MARGEAPSLAEADPLAFVSMGEGEVDVLVVDDSAATRRMLVGKCERLGLTVEAAADGRVALEKLQSKKYNLVSMDNQMPNDLSGVECVEAAPAARARRGVASSPFRRQFYGSRALGPAETRRDRGIDEDGEPVDLGRARRLRR